MDPVTFAIVLGAITYAVAGQDRFTAPVRSGVRAGVRSGAGQGVRSTADRWRAGQPRRADRRQRGRERLDRFSIPLPQFGRRPRVFGSQVSAPISGAPGGGQVKGGRKAAAPPASITAPPPRPPRKRIPVGRGLNRFADGVQAAVGGTARTALGAGAIGWEAGRTATRTGREEWATARREHEERRARGERTRAGRAVRLVGHKIRGTVDGEGEREDQLRRELDPVLAAGSAEDVVHAAQLRPEQRTVGGVPVTESGVPVRPLRPAEYLFLTEEQRNEYARLPMSLTGITEPRTTEGQSQEEWEAGVFPEYGGLQGWREAQEGREPPAQQALRQPDGLGERPKDTRFFALRNAGYKGWINQDGMPTDDEGRVDLGDEVAARVLRRRAAEGDRVAQKALMLAATAAANQTTPPTGGGSTTRTEAPVSVDIETYEDLETELGQVENGWDEHAAPLLAQFAALARAWDEHGEQAKAAVQRAKDINEDVTDQNGFVPGQAVLAAIEAMVEQLGAVQATFFEAATEDLETVSKADQAAKDADETITAAIDATKKEHELVGDVAAETGADVRTTAAV